MFQLLLQLASQLYYFALHVTGAGSFPAPLSAAREAELLEKSRNGELAARNLLIEHNLRLVAHIVKKYYTSGADQDDLISIGTIGLIKAVSTFKSDKNIRLATYAARCIENEILMSIRASKRYSKEVSLSLPIGTDKDGNEISLNDILGSDTDEIIDSINLKLQVGKLYRAIDDCLSKREKAIIVARYGLDGSDAKPQREIASELSISRSYVSRIEKRALEKLRNCLEASAADRV